MYTHRSSRTLYQEGDNQEQDYDQNQAIPAHPGSGPAATH